jgi:leucine dehydrogenase
LPQYFSDIITMMMMLSCWRSRKIEDLPEFDDHEAVLFLSDKKTKLRSFVAIHSTVLGPATGGTRCFRYKSELDAIRDALRLSRSMTYKCALAGVPFGGGKGVIALSSDKDKSLALIRAYAREINTLGGSFSTGEDVGLTERDVLEMEKISPHINGPAKVGELGPWAALGVFSAIKAGLKEIFGSTSLSGRTFAIRGIGKVGLSLCGLIYENGGTVLVAEIDRLKIRKILQKYPGVRIVSPRDIHRQRVDVYAPCAMGNEFDSKNIYHLHCKIICGGANNQLAIPSLGMKLHQRGILYIPDYVANAGGLINAVAHMMKGGYNEVWVGCKVEAIEETTKSLIALSKKSRSSLSDVADGLAKKILLKRARKA